VRRRFPESAAHVEAKLRQWGGNSSGVNVANIDNLGNVHPDTMWWHHTLGSVKDAPVLANLAGYFGCPDGWPQAAPAGGQGALRRMRLPRICNGNTRVRAQQMTGDAWAEDPGCYLSDEEIGL
jgi:MoaA/NifB/PqqE/SkfB family radical SAM enzyme